jgi:ABC-2 type transport system ATP-binding protein
MSSVLQFDHVTKQYGGFGRPQIRALDDFSLEVEQGEIFGFLGPNGAGKTTAIHLALGFMRLTRGSGTMLGKPFGHAPTRARVGFLPENIALYHRPASRLLRFYGALNGMRDPQLARHVRIVLDAVEMTDQRDRNVGKFSRGMQQRIGLAQAVVNDPELLVLDEPTSALDPLGRIAVRELLQHARRSGKTIFLSSHLLSEVEMLCDRVAILNRGRLLRVGKTSELLERRGASIITARGVSAADFGGTKTVEGLASIPVSREVQREVIERIWAAGGEVVSVVPVRRSLEDLFVELAGVDDAAHRYDRVPR